MAHAGRHRSLAHDGAIRRTDFAYREVASRIFTRVGVSRRNASKRVENVQFPEKLAYGSYAIREVEAVAPYLLRTEPVYFEVSEEHDWASDDLLEIDLPNEAATGTIKAAKIDAESKEAVAGAHYEIIAKDDIATPDEPSITKRRRGSNGRDRRAGGLDGRGSVSWKRLRDVSNRRNRIS